MTVSSLPKTPVQSPAAAPCCPNCGTTLEPPDISSSDPTTALLAAQKQIADLQAQVRLLNQKAAAAVDRWADYEDELTRLRAASTATNTTTTTATSATTATTALTAASSQYPPRSHTPSQSQGGLSAASASSPRASFLNAGASRISQLLSPRSKAAAAQNLASATAAGQRASLSTGALPLSPGAGGLPSPAPSHDDLLEALSREQGLRIAAEGKLDETSKEIEDLSATLFEQANEMVATERKARARLEERVETLEKRDSEKRNRLERLEGAMGRIERVNRLLND
ncbi:hypothetical protein KJ359_007368 [Pestalotiopsis sp. 9143b]|nr:hypothetical protein KJ359_007368 [Pestalotiopsis sp. 9143b]